MQVVSCCLISQFLVLLLVYAIRADSRIEVFDVVDFGAVAEGNDSSEAFLAAWKAACEFGGIAKFAIPRGSFIIGPVDFIGPCNNETIVEINGTVRALPHFHGRPWITFQSLNQLIVTGGGILDGQGVVSWPTNECHTNPSCKVPPTSLVFEKVSNSTVWGLSLVNSKGFHMNFHHCDHIDIRNITITAPGDSPNTDGIHMGNSDHISITSSVIGTGDDCISIGPGSTNVYVSDVFCGPGHGISVGSLGKEEDEMDVVGLHVKDCIIVNTTNGVRIKTWPGSKTSRASNFTFEGITMINVSNPIIIDQEYCPTDGCTSKPSQVEISNVMFRRISGTSNTEVAVKLACSRMVPCRHVELQDVALVCSGEADGCNTTASSCSNVDGTSSGLQLPTPCL